MGIWSRIKSVFAPVLPEPPQEATPILPEDDEPGADLEDEAPLACAPPIARDRDLEAAIAADPDAPEPYLVYGDWLQERGDPRGELIALQEKLLATTDVTEHETLEERVESLLSEHREYLAGPAHHGEIDVTYHLGFVRTLSTSSIEHTDRLDEILSADHPALLFLRRLCVPSNRVEMVGELLRKVGRTNVTVVDGDERLFDPELVPKVTASIERDEAVGTINVEIEDGPFSSAIGYSYLARTKVGDDEWWHGSGDALTEEIMCDDPMKSGAATIGAFDKPLQIEVRARLPTEDTDHTLWFRGRADAGARSLLLHRCEPRTGAPFEIPAPANASPRLGPVLMPPDDGHRYARDRNAALPGLGVYEHASSTLHTESGARIVLRPHPPGDCWEKTVLGGADRALVFVHDKRGNAYGSWLTTTRAGEQRAQIDVGGIVYGGAIDPRGRWFAALALFDASRLVVFDIETGKMLGVVDVPFSEMQSYGVVWSGSTAFAIGDGAANGIDVTTGATSKLVVPRPIGFGWRQYGHGTPTYHHGLGRSAWMMCAEFPDETNDRGTTLISWRDHGGPYCQVVVPDHGWGMDDQFATVIILDDGRIVGIGTRLWVVDPTTRVATDHGEPGVYPPAPVTATVDGRVRLYSCGGGPSWIEL